MPGGYLYGWYENGVNSKWVKMQCDASGFLKVDPGELFENPPVEDQAKKGPSSEWAYDHWKNVAAHHAKYTDAEARTAIGDLLDLTGKLIKELDANYFAVVHLNRFRLQYSALSDIYVNVRAGLNSPILTIEAYKPGVGYVSAGIKVYSGGVYHDVAFQLWVTAAIATHTAIVAAHHARYTDLEAQTACKLNGSLYWSCKGIAFDATNPAINLLIKSAAGCFVNSENALNAVASVNLPHGATVTGAIVYGNVAIESSTWYLLRVPLDDCVSETMATAVCNTEDDTIADAVIDNANYGYILIVSTMETADQITGARITYTL